MRREDYVIVSFFLIICTLSLMQINREDKVSDGINELNRNVKSLIIEQNRLQMYNKSVIPYLKRSGIYFPTEEYYCVWVKNQTQEKIVSVECHEQCHWMIDSQTCYDNFGNTITCKKHFCEC